MAYQKTTQEEFIDYFEMMKKNNFVPVFNTLETGRYTYRFERKEFCKPANIIKARGLRIQNYSRHIPGVDIYDQARKLPTDERTKTEFLQSSGGSSKNADAMEDSSVSHVTKPISEGDNLPW